MAPSSPNISGLKNIFAFSIICFTILTMKNFHVSSMSLSRNMDVDNYIEEMMMRKNPEFAEFDLPSLSVGSVGGGREDREDRFGGESNGDDSIGMRDELMQYDANDGEYWRNKRFLGTMARGNWFPRPFRRFIDSDVYPGADLTKYRHIALLTYPEKKHVGSVTRVKLLSLPSVSARRSYLQQQLDDDDDDDEE